MTNDILEKIRAEIQWYADNKADALEMKAYYHCLQIIDKHKESIEQSNSDEDCISRKDAEMCLTADITDITIEEYISMVGDRLKGLPSVQPKEAYNKGWKDGAEATAYHVELCEKENPTIPMAVIEDIKAEISKTVCEELNYCDVNLSFLKWCAGLKYSLRIIDKHIEDIGGK